MRNITECMEVPSGIEGTAIELPGNFATPANTLGMGGVEPLITDPLPRKYKKKMKMKSLKLKLQKIKPIVEAWEPGEVKNMKLRKLLDKAGYQNVHLAKGNGYFYLFTTGDSEISNIVDTLSDTSFYLYSFNQQSPEEWFKDIDNMIKTEQR